MVMEYNTIRVFDQVRLSTTRNITYLSAPTGTKIEPHGIWSVSGAFEDGTLLCVKNNAVVRVPASDVFRVFSYDISKITEKLGRLTDG
jgi:hypothetical protein